MGNARRGVIVTHHRLQEEGRAIAALEYEAYSPMAEKVIREIVQDIASRHRCLFARVRHRIGVVLQDDQLFVGTLDNFLRPVLIKRGADLPLLLIFAGVIGGLLSLGVVGIFVGPVVLAVTYRLIGEWVRGGLEERGPAAGAGGSGARRVLGRKLHAPVSTRRQRPPPQGRDQPRRAAAHRPAAGHGGTPRRSAR